jgi:hypothetical protein
MPTAKHRAQTRLSRSASKIGFGAGALAFAISAIVTTSSVSSAEPRHDLQQAAVVAQAEEAAEPTTFETLAPAPAPAPEPIVAPAPPPPPVYENNLDGWIRQSLDILHARGIPASYEGIHRNIMRESTGNPQAINLWDSNAAKGIPSKGLLQVIDPTFAAYHVEGTAFDVWDPVANIAAACNYAAHRYGSMDNVNSAY